MGEPVRNITLGRPKPRWDYNIKMDLVEPCLGEKLILKWIFRRWDGEHGPN